MRAFFLSVFLCLAYAVGWAGGTADYNTAPPLELQTSEWGDASRLASVSAPAAAESPDAFGPVQAPSEQSAFLASAAEFAEELTFEQALETRAIASYQSPPPVLASAPDSRWQNERAAAPATPARVIPLAYLEGLGLGVPGSLATLVGRLATDAADRGSGARLLFSVPLRATPRGALWLDIRRHRQGAVSIGISLQASLW